MTRSYIIEATRRCTCEESGVEKVRITLERGSHMGVRVAFVSECNQYEPKRRRCTLSGKLCPYSVDGTKALEAFSC